MPPGTLYIVATPLGNLADLSARAAEILRTVPLVAAEDTRRTRGLLAHLGARPSVRSYHAHSDAGSREQLLEALRGGQDVALVSDAGTPGISDPGTDLVAGARAGGIPVVPIPGASAVAAALSAAGVPGDRYLFLGFIPRKGTERIRLLARAAGEEWSVVIFEAPTRLGALLRDLTAMAGPDRRVVVARELTKMHEEIRSGSLGELADYYSQVSPRGEITLVVEGTGRAPPPPDRTKEAKILATALIREGLSRKDVVLRLTGTLGLPRNEAYQLVMECPDVT